jgi:flagellar assembly protein FliH
MTAAVLRLAAERAGQAIDADPAPFARRVAALAARLSHAAADFELRLHPDDLARLAPLVAAGLSADLAGLACARLVADETLARGDADLSAPGLRLADLLADLEPPVPSSVPAPLPDTVPVPRHDPASDPAAPTPAPLPGAA